MNTALQTQYHNPIVIDQEKKMTTLGFSKLTGEDHRNVLVKIRAKVEIGEQGFLLGSYLDKQNQERAMYEMTFAASISLANSYQSGKYFHLIMSGFENVLQEIHAKTKPQLKLENKVSELKSELLAEKRKTIAASDNVNRIVRRTSAALRELTEEGICDRIEHIRAYYNYPVSEYGKSLGWTNNRNGTLVHCEDGIED